MIAEFDQVFLTSKLPSQQEKEALDDLAMELELADEDQPVLYVRSHPRKQAACRLILIKSYKVGEAFIHLPHHRAVKRLESDQTQVDGEIAKLTEVVDQCERDMKALKVTLYARFGNAINLDE